MYIFKLQQKILFFIIILSLKNLNKGDNSCWFIKQLTLFLNPPPPYVLYLDTNIYGNKVNSKPYHIILISPCVKKNWAFLSTW